MDDVIFRIAREARAEVEPTIDLESAWAGLLDRAASASPEQEPSPSPWSWILAAAAALVLVVGGAAFLIRDRPSSLEIDDQAAPADTAIEPLPTTTVGSTTTIAAVAPTSSLSIANPAATIVPASSLAAAPPTAAPSTTVSPMTVAASTTVAPSTSVATTSTSVPEPVASPPWQGARQFNADGSLGLPGLNEHIASSQPTWAYDPTALAEMIAGPLVESEGRVVGFDGLVVTITTSGHADDSVYATRLTLTLQQPAAGEAYVVTDARWGQACQPGRGHQDFTPELCV